MNASRPRIGLISSPEATEWRSCISIGRNLLEAYKKAFTGQCTVFNCGGWRKPSDIREAAHRIRVTEPDRIVFLDHVPHPEVILRELKPLYAGAARLPRVRIHLCGEFTRSARTWLDAEPVLKNWRIQWVCASERQARLIGLFFSGERPDISVCPFPVDARIFSDDEELRKQWRKRLGVKADMRLFVYSGRISPQKNVLRLASEFLTLAPANPAELRMAIAGPVDDSYFRQWTRFLRKLDPGQRALIRHLGDLGPAQLRGLYNAADLFVSLSLYRDEDFGLAPAEALCCGTPAVLSSWGGYAGFNAWAKAGDCRLVPVRLGRDGPGFDSESVQRALRGQLSLRVSAKARARRSRAYRDELSIDGIARKLKKLERRAFYPFRGFGTSLRKFCDQPSGKSRSRIYREYVSDG